MAVIAIDLGTTGCKSALFDGSEMLASAYRHFSYTAPEDGWAEQDPESVWDLVDQTVRQAIASCRAVPDVEAVCVSVQGDAVMPINHQGTALHPAILGMDTRSAQEAEDLQEEFGRGQLYAATGMPCEPLNAITKIFWLARHHPELRKSLWKYVQYGDFLLMKLAGIPALDFTMASRTMAFDPVRKDWVPGILEFVGIAPSQLGNLSPSGTPIGIILKSVADSWGISRSALVVTGGHDQCLAAVGAGVIEPDLACYSMGTAEVISTCFPTPCAGSAMLEANYPCYCHAVPDHYFTITLNQSGGLSLEWFQNHVMGFDQLPGPARAAAIRCLLDEVRIQPSIVMFLPHIVGSGTPACDHLSRGTFLGLSLKTGRRDMFQAVVDALAFEARLNLETLADRDIPILELRGVGGGTRSERLLELKATVLNRPIRTLKNPEAALLGAGILAQVAIGHFESIEEACRECVAIDRTIEPRRDAVEVYTAAFQRFRQIHGTLRSFYHNWRAECRTAVLV
jgi:xylulokinase